MEGRLRESHPSSQPWLAPHWLTMLHGEQAKRSELMLSHGDPFVFPNWWELRHSVLPPLAVWASPGTSRNKTNHPRRLLLLQTPRCHGQIFSCLSVRHPSTCPSQSLQNQPKLGLLPSGCPACTLCLPGLRDHAHLGPCGITSKWDLLSQTCSTGAFPALWELMTLST